MYHLVNPYGNVHKMVQSEAKKDEMLKDGWKLVTKARGGRNNTSAAKQAEEPKNAPDGDAEGKKAPDGDAENEDDPKKE